MLYGFKRKTLCESKDAKTIFNVVMAHSPGHDQEKSKLLFDTLSYQPVTNRNFMWIGPDKRTCV